MSYAPYHAAYDKEKLSALISDMKINGWQGGPVVADGEWLITGSHRYEAARRSDTALEAVDIRDIYPEWDTLYAEFDEPSIGTMDYIAVILTLPSDLREEYGIDAH